MQNLNEARFSTQGEYLYQLLQDIKARPGMFLGNCSITRLRSFLNGYCSARADLGLPLTEQEKAFNEFQSWIQQRFHIASSQGWDRIILFHATDERAALDLFFELFDQFQAEVITLIESASIA
ncbi:MAG: hypothetical protein HC936_00835 [Leptolyngbyaceae cyanobacterium SU_3_3]|nr:hypothetical protein [Leptolyngbyaceae cyanobacterium SU_3_3]